MRAFLVITLIPNENNVRMWTFSESGKFYKLFALQTNGVFFSTKKCALYLKKCNFVFVS